MKRNIVVALCLLAAAFVSLRLTRSQTVPTGAPPAESPISFKIVFGESQQRTADYSGSISLSEGKVVRLTPWRFFQDDRVNGTDAWKLSIKRANFENQPDAPRPIATPGQNQNVVPAGVIVTVDAPLAASARVATAQGNFDIRLADLQYDRVLWFLNGDVMVQRTPTTQPLSVAGGREEHDYPSAAMAKNGTVWVAWQGYESGGEHVYARHSTAAGWSEPFTLTDRRGDIFHTALGEDADGRIWVVWSERNNEDWDLYARTYDGRQWSSRRKLTSGDQPNIFHRLLKDPSGALHLVWIGHQNGESHVLWSKLSGAQWSKPVEISGASAWMPDVAVDSQNNLYVAWDSYRAGNYDIFLRRIGADGKLGPLEQVTKSPRFQAHATVAVDRQDRVWVAWDESGANWGKDWARDDMWRGTVMYANRNVRLAVLENGLWKQPLADVMRAIPARYNRFVQVPHLASDAAGRIWLAVQVRTSTAMNRTDFWANNGRWEHFLLSYEGNRWTAAMPVPNTSSRPDGVFNLLAGPRGIWAAWVNDNRAFGIAEGPARNNARNEIDVASFASAAAAPPAQFEAFNEPPANAAGLHADERAGVSRTRGYRLSIANTTYRIMRGDFHRHTEISGDGAGDGSVEDFFRYMIDAAQMDTGIITDHNAGQDNEYTWWRTEKAHDLFHIPDRFTPLFGYERSVNYPNGHRNVVFAQRGVRTLPIRAEEQKGVVNTGPILYPYLKQNRGICMLHSLATDQGSDFRDNDPEVEPLVEIYQGYHANYEYEGAPRAETSNYFVTTHGPYRPAGFYWNALAKGYKLGVQSSSDHIATHTSYTMIYTPSDKRLDIVESMRQRHAYGATDNIVLEFRAMDEPDRMHLMGDSFQAKTSPRFFIKALGTGAIAKVEIVKDGKFVYQTEPNASTVEFTYLDNAPGNAESYYYVRVIQGDRNMAWSSPIWVKYARN